MPAVTPEPARKHLDLGCGQHARNPYGWPQVYGIDVHDGRSLSGLAGYRQVDLSLNPIPFPDDMFASVSAFDFIEHIPRQAAVNGRMTLPFLELMNEVWRVLEPGGLFYAVTPAYPAAEAFQDPTHVNIITDKTHEYFCGTESFGRNYGFHGNFEAVRVRWVTPKNAYTADTSFRKTLRHWHRRLIGRDISHVLWELRALK